MAQQLLVPAPQFAPSQFGLLSTVEPRYTETDPHWQMGVRHPDLCGMGGNFFDPCITDGDAEDGDEKSATSERAWFESHPFTVYGRVDCPPIGYTEQEGIQAATDALTRTEGWQVEAAVWSGQNRLGVTASGNGNRVARLASNETLFASGLGPTVTIQTAATVIGVTGTPLDITEAIQRLEQAFMDCYGEGQGVLHVPWVLGSMLFRANAVKVDGPVLRTQTGNKVALGAGYRGTGPGAASSGGAAAPANTSWIYMTGPVFAYRSDITVLGNTAQALDLATNTLERVAERTYVVGWLGCCHLAALVSTGGIVTGQPASAF